MYEWFFQKLLYPTYESLLRRRKTLHYLREYQQSQWFSADELQTLQWRKLKALLNHCYRFVPYYRSTWQDLGLEPGDIKTMADFQKLPYLTKDIIRANYTQLIANNYRDSVLTKTTGGSTGQPLQLALDSDSNQRRTAVMWRCYGWSGVNLGTRTSYLWGTDIGEVSPFNQLKKKLYQRVFNQQYLDVFTMTTKTMPTYVDALNRHRADAIVSYAEPLVRLAKYIKNNKLSVHSPKTIITGAESLHDHQRSILEDVFHCPVSNTYGCREFMSIAAECNQHRGLHINTDHLVVETLDEHKQNVIGTSGEVITTDCHNFGMPFIRYANGDLATISTETCPCGRNLPLMWSIDGRKVDVIRTRTDHTLTGLFFPHLFKDITAIDKFQVIQKDLDSLDIHVVPISDLDEADQHFINNEIRKRLTDMITINWHITNEIPLTASGKHRVIISKLNERSR